MYARKLGKSGIYLTDLSLGAMTFGDSSSRGTDPRTSIRIIHQYLDAGGNHIDTANVYSEGESERIVGKALQGKRDEVILATKVNFPMGEGLNRKGLSRSSIMHEVEASLQRLQTDYIDLLYMHAWDFVTPIEETLRALSDLVRSGKVRYLGASNFKAWQLMKAIGLARATDLEPLVAGQYQYSLVKRDIEYEFSDLLPEEGVGLLPWGPLGGGFLSGKYKPGQRPVNPDDGRIAVSGEDIEEAWERRNTEQNWDILDVASAIATERDTSVAAVALAWVRRQPMVTSVILGVRTPEQLDANLQAAELQLTNEENDRLLQASRLPELYPYRFLDNYARRNPTSNTKS